MPQTAPKYVRLSQHMVSGCHVDINSGFGVSGFDVKQVPDHPHVQAFVVAAINRGIYEEASAAEYEEVQESNFSLFDEDTPKVIMIDPSKPLPENVLRQAIDQHSQKVQARAAEREEALLTITEDTPGDAYPRLSEQALRSELSARGVNSGGTKAEVISRLRAHDAGGHSPSDVTDDTPYDEMSKKDLVAEASRRGLSSAGTKDDLVERLEENDQANDGTGDPTS